MSRSPIDETEGITPEYASGWEEILKLVNTGGSWSGHERNCCFLNTGAPQFADVSAVTGLDFLDDGRCICPVDWDHDGDLDLWLSARTGPRLRFLRNDLVDATNDGDAPQPHYIAFRLKGTTCNRDAIGAQVHIQVGDETLIRSLRAGDAYMSQGSKWVHFGLGQYDEIKSITVHWPGGEAESIEPVSCDARYTIEQGQGAAAPWAGPRRSVALASEMLATQQDENPGRVFLSERVPMPKLNYQGFEGQDAAVGFAGGKPTFISLWAAWCAPCLEELSEITTHAQEFRDAGVEVLALSVDGLGSDSTTADAQRWLEQAEFPFAAGVASNDLVNRLDALQQVLVSLRRDSNAIPISFLVDRHGRLAAIYTGRVSVETVLDDVSVLDSDSGHGIYPFPGQWFVSQWFTDALLFDLAEEFYKRQLHDDALRYASLAVELGSRSAIAVSDANWVSNLFYEAGNAAFQDGDLKSAVRHYQSCVRTNPRWVQAYTNLGAAYRASGDMRRGEMHLKTALEMEPQLFQANYNMGILCLQDDRPQEAVDYLDVAIQHNDRLPSLQNHFGVALARVGQKDRGKVWLQRAASLGNQEAIQNLQTLAQGGTP